MDVVRERLEREFDLDLLVTTPNVAYEVHTTHGLVEVHNPSQMPDANSIEETHEPYVKASLIVPKEYVGTIMELAQERRGEFDHMEYLSPDARAADLPAAARRDRARLLRPAQEPDEGLRLVRLRARRATARPTSSSSTSCSTASRSTRSASIVHRDKAYAAGKALVERLRKRDPAAVVRRADPGLDRLAHHRPRDHQGQAQGRARQVLRRRRHAQAQAAREAEEGQEAHEAVGSVEVPQEAFLAVLSLDGEGTSGSSAT